MSDELIGKFIDMQTGSVIERAAMTPEQLRLADLFELVNSWQQEDYRVVLACLSEAIGAVVATMRFVDTVDQITLRDAYKHAAKSLAAHKRMLLLDQDFKPTGKPQ